MKKLGKHLWQGLFCENCGITGHSLLEVKSNTDTAKHLTKVLTVPLKDKKSSRNNMKESLHFKQSRLNYIKCQEKALKISNRLYWDRFGTQKSMMRFKCHKYHTNMQLLFICFLYCVKEGRVIESIKKK